MIMVCKAETHKKLEVCIGVFDDCLDMLLKAETRYDVFGDSMCELSHLMNE